MSGGSDDVTALIKDNLPIAIAVAGAVVASAYLMLSGGGGGGGGSGAKSKSSTASVSDSGAATKSKRKRKKKKSSKTSVEDNNDTEDEEQDEEQDDDGADLAKKPQADTPAADGDKKKKKKKKAKAKAPVKEDSEDEPKVEKPKPKKPKPVSAKILKDAFDDGFSVKKKQSEGAWDTVGAEKKTKVKKPKAAADSSSGSVVSDSRKIEVKIPANKVGILIGPLGATLKKFQEEYGVKIDIPKSGGSDSYIPRNAETSVFIEGGGSSATQCKADIQQLMTKGYCNALNKGFTEGSVEMYSDYFHLLIGKEGKTLRALEAAFGVTINIPGKSAQIGNKPQWVKIAGKKDSIEKAKAEIKQIMKLYYSKVADPHMRHLALEIPFGHYKALIGVRGQTIKDIQRNTKCTINIPRANSKTDLVVLVGPSDAAITTCKTQMDRAIERYNAQTTRKFEDEHNDYSEEEPDHHQSYHQSYHQEQEPEPEQPQAQEEWGGGSGGW